MGSESPWTHSLSSALEVAVLQEDLEALSPYASQPHLVLLPPPANEIKQFRIYSCVICMEWVSFSH